MSIAKTVLLNLTGRSFTAFRRVMSLRTSHVGRIAIPAEMKVELTDVEDRICMLFDDCSKYLTKEKGINTTCRIAGGWVRDKVNLFLFFPFLPISVRCLQLLGSDSNDIDIALSDIMGLTFAEYLTEYAGSKGVRTGAIGKIAQNPDQSKHLETATLKILGLDIDLVNLRSEEYADDSRIPSEVVSDRYVYA
jgi:tRNA nucleotidyltransferase (CCA-adding enzyme)